MWEKILTMEILEKIIFNLGDEPTEDMDTMTEFTNYLINNIDYKYIILLAIKWNSYDEERKAYHAIELVGEFHASRLMIMMDELADRFAKGKLN